MSEKRDLHFELMRLEVAPTFQKMPKNGIKRQLYELYIEVINRAIEAENELIKLQQENAELKEEVGKYRGITQLAVLAYKSGQICGLDNGYVGRLANAVAELKGVEENE